MMVPCINPPHIIYNPTLTTQCLYSYNGFTTCVPWLTLEQMRNSSEIDPGFGLMYGIKNENIRRKLGYGTGAHKLPKRTKQAFRKNQSKQYKPSRSLNSERNFVNTQRCTTAYTDDPMPVRQQTSGTYDREKVKTIRQRGNLFANLLIYAIRCRQYTTKWKNIIKPSNISEEEY